MALSLVLRSFTRNQTGLLSRSANFTTASNVIRVNGNTIKTISPAAKQIPSVYFSRNFALTPTRASATGGGHHSALWTAERALSLGLLGVIPAAIAFPSQGLDTLLALSIVMHHHWGLDTIVTDYVRPILVGNVIPKVAHGLLLLFSVAKLGSLFYFIYNDIGIAKAIRRLWVVKGQ